MKPRSRVRTPRLTFFIALAQMVERGPFTGKPLGEPTVAGSNPACDTFDDLNRSSNVSIKAGSILYQHVSFLFIGRLENIKRPIHNMKPFVSMQFIEPANSVFHMYRGRSLLKMCIGITFYPLKGKDGEYSSEDV